MKSTKARIKAELAADLYADALARGCPLTINQAAKAARSSTRDVARTLDERGVKRPKRGKHESGLTLWRRHVRAASVVDLMALYPCVSLQSAMRRFGL